MAVLSDIHGNLEALEAVLAAIDRIGFDLLYSLGDIVGYGPDPAECVDVVRRRFDVSLTGNHDAAAAGLSSLEDFNEFARWAVEWTARRLCDEDLAYLRSLPYIHRAPGLLCAHSSPVEPQRWHYIHGLADVGDFFAAFTERLCFVGHSHRPGVYAIREGRNAARHGEQDKLQPGLRYLVNAGSVGQPRDRNPQAAYVIYDEADARVEVRRVTYPVAKTQQKMRAAGIPSFLVDRLDAGV